MAKKQTSIDLSEEILNGINDLQQRKLILNKELAAIGELKIIYKNREEQARQYFNVNMQLEQSISKEIEDTYGKGRVDLQEGKFYPAN